MPLTLSKEAYCSVMVTKEETAAQAGAYTRPLLSST
jgi:hypothetical protein